MTGTETSEGFTGIIEEQTPRGVFVAVHLTVVNTGMVPAAFPFSDLRLTDGAGRVFSPDSDTTTDWLIQNTDFYQSAELQPGLPYEAVVFFDVPRDATGLAPTTSDGVFTIALDR